MSVQLSYVRETRDALPGLIADIGPREIASRSNSTPGSAVIPFGRVVGIDVADDESCVLGIGGGYLGISIREAAKENTTVGSESTEYRTTETVGIFRSGKIWALMAVGGVPGDAIRFDDATGIIDAGVAGGGETQIDNAVLENTVAAGGLGLIRIGA